MRELSWGRDRISIPDGWTIETSPRYPLRGHQMGYRPKTNSYDGWNLAMWERYIRDLVAFGMNAIELIPPRSDDATDSPHFPAPPMKMMADVARAAASYGLEIWVWYPALDENYEDPSQVNAAIREWTEVLSQLPRVDAIFVPGGDPGHTRPRVLFPFLEKQAAALRAIHPNLQIFVGPHQFSPEWMDEMVAETQRQPAWLAGIGFGPGGRMPLRELKQRLPAQFKVRRYPDITHSRLAQYPVPDWDAALALTAAREPINPRPRDMALIHDHLADAAMGFIAYSEGCNDDVNKIVWLAKGWNPEEPVEETLRQYGRYFFGDRLGPDVGLAMLDLEANWRGPLAVNGRVAQTLVKLQALEREAEPQHLLNWRFQMALYRAYSDAYTQKRLIEEKARENEAVARLSESRRLGSQAAMAQADEILRKPTASLHGPLRARIGELAEALYQSIRMQTSVSKYRAIGTMRGATLDTVDVLLAGDGYWRKKIAEWQTLSDEQLRLKAIDEALNRTNPGLGGHYDDLGDPFNQPHLVRSVTYDKDPGYLSGGVFLDVHGPDSSGSPVAALPPSVWTQAETLNGNPLKMRYEALSREASYRVRVVYGVYVGAPGTPAAKLKLEAEGILVHDYLDRPARGQALEFPIPAEATADGTLELTFRADMRIRGPGRGLAVAEVWLIRAAP
ncbi:MAG: hypothetical protein SFV18_05240 [Bryobacteraceae bacterium]|nr:hypothetical protein [Bryobacteraceae bacterium]